MKFFNSFLFILFCSSIGFSQTLVCPGATTVFKDWPNQGQGTAISNIQYFIESIEPGQTSGPITAAPMSGGSGSCIDLDAAPPVADGGRYRIYPVKDVDHRNGVSTLDLVLIARHLIGTSSPLNPFQLLASDVDDSQSINVLDILTLHKLILYINNELPTTSWKFVDRSVDLINNPGDISKDFIEIDPNNPPSELLFWGVKMGDINANNSPFSAGNDDLKLRIENRDLVAGETITVDFLAQDFQDFLAYQFSLVFDQNVLAYEAHESVGLPGNDLIGWNTTEAQTGVIPNLWVGLGENIEIKDGEPLFSVTFKVLGNSTLQEVLRANSVLTQNLAYTKDSEEASKVVLDFNLTTNLENQKLANDQLMQNQPNPVDQFTIIPFSLEKPGKVELSITDALGRIVKSMEWQGLAGSQQIELQRTDFGAAGLYHYTLKTAYSQISKPLIVK